MLPQNYGKRRKGNPELCWWWTVLRGPERNSSHGISPVWPVEARPGPLERRASLLKFGGWLHYLPREEEMTRAEDTAQAVGRGEGPETQQHQAEGREQMRDLGCCGGKWPRILILQAKELLYLVLWQREVMECVKEEAGWAPEFN